MRGTLLLALVGLVVVAHAQKELSLNTADSEDKCEAGQPCSKNFRYEETCAQAIRDQVSREMHASVTYLAFGAHFAQVSVSRPGVSAMFFKHAYEERQHAFKLADYLSMRGDHDTNYLRSTYTPLKDESTNIKEALIDALAIEKDVTRFFTDMAKTCEKDFHATDFLSGEMLDEQHKGTREIAEMITRLNKMMMSQPNLGEYMFDRDLQKSAAEKAEVAER